MRIPLAARPRRPSSDLGRVMTSVGLLAIWTAAAGCAQTVQPDAPAPEELRVTSTGGVTLAGTLYLPAGDGPHAAVIVTHGSEPARRRNAGYIQWAESIRARGLAALIYDKRGVANSEGTYIEAPDIQVPADDVQAWFRHLIGRNDIDPSRTGVLGFSQGGWVGPLAASQSDLAFVVSISGPGVSPLEQNIYDKSNRVIDPGGVTPEQARLVERAIRLVMTYLFNGENYEEAKAAWEAVADEPWFASRYNGVPMVRRDLFLADPRSGSYVQHSAYEPVPALEALQVPMLAVFGGADRIVPVERSVDIMQAAFERSGNPDFTHLIFEGANHGIRVGSAFAPGYPDAVFDWIVRITN